VRSGSATQAETVLALQLFTMSAAECFDFPLVAQQLGLSTEITRANNLCLSACRQTQLTCRLPCHDYNLVLIRHYSGCDGEKGLLCLSGSESVPRCPQ
jgi:hypothetical protein